MLGGKKTKDRTITKCEKNTGKVEKAFSNSKTSKTNIRYFKSIVDGLLQRPIEMAVLEEFAGLKGVGPQAGFRTTSSEEEGERMTYTLHYPKRALAEAQLLSEIYSANEHEGSFNKDSLEQKDILPGIMDEELDDEKIDRLVFKGIWIPFWPPKVCPWFRFCAAFVTSEFPKRLIFGRVFPYEIMIEIYGREIHNSKMCRQI